jgi:hypothetical protein
MANEQAQEKEQREQQEQQQENHEQLRSERDVRGEVRDSHLEAGRAQARRDNASAGESNTADSQPAVDTVAEDSETGQETGTRLATAASTTAVTGHNGDIY